LKTAWKAKVVRSMEDTSAKNGRTKKLRHRGKKTKEIRRGSRGPADAQKDKKSGSKQSQDLGT